MFCYRSLQGIDPQSAPPPGRWSRSVQTFQRVGQSLLMTSPSMMPLIQPWVQIATRMMQTGGINRWFQRFTQIDQRSCGSEDTVTWFPEKYSRRLLVFPVHWRFFACAVPTFSVSGVLKLQNSLNGKLGLSQVGSQSVRVLGDLNLSRFVSFCLVCVSNGLCLLCLALTVSWCWCHRFFGNHLTEATAAKVPACWLLFNAFPVSQLFGFQVVLSLPNGFLHSVSHESVFHCLFPIKTAWSSNARGTRQLVENVMTPRQHTFKEAVQLPKLLRYPSLPKERWQMSFEQFWISTLD